MTELNDMGADDFSALASKEFSLNVDGTAVTLTLAEVTESGGGLRGKGAFSLLWDGPIEPVLPQATYQIAHEEIGTHGMFLVPVARTASGYQYEAVFA